MKLLVKDAVNKINLDCTGYIFSLLSKSAKKSMQSLGECRRIYIQPNLTLLCHDFILFDETKEKRHPVSYYQHPWCKCL